MSSRPSRQAWAARPLSLLGSMLWSNDGGFVSPLLFLAWAAAGVAVGTYGTLVGAGGGFALVPILLLVYPRQSPAQLTAVSLAVVFANVVSGSIGYSR